MDHTFSNSFGGVVLSPLAESDLEALRRLRNQNATWFLNSAEISEEQQRAWYQRYLQKKNDVMFRVGTRERREQFIGAVALYDIDRETGQAEFGRLMIDREAAGRSGLGYDATMCACEFGFARLGLQRIYLDVYADNIAAVKTYEKAGFYVYDQKKEKERKILYLVKTPEI